MIIVKIWGGLGNQMFQYAFGRYLSKMRNEIPHYFCEHEENNNIPIIKRYFYVKIDPIQQEKQKEINYLLKNGINYRLHRKIYQKLPFISNKVFVEDDLLYKSIKSNFSIFDGYWQSYKYLENIQAELINDFAFRIDKSTIDNIEILESIRNSNSISIHLRRGDYLSYKNNKIFAICQLDYYKKAIEHFCHYVNDPVFFIFSNDIKWCQNQVHLFKNIKHFFVINTSALDSSIIDMYTMKQCKHNIIANSTYSWWAAWLNSNPDKIIIAPKNWYIGKRNLYTKDLIPSSWIRL